MRDAALAGDNVAFRSLHRDIPDLLRFRARNQLRKTGGQDAASLDNILQVHHLPIFIHIRLIDRYGSLATAACIDVPIQRLHEDITAIISGDAGTVHVDVPVRDHVDVATPQTDDAQGISN